MGQVPQKARKEKPRRKQLRNPSGLKSQRKEEMMISRLEAEATGNSSDHGAIQFQMLLESRTCQRALCRFRTSFQRLEICNMNKTLQNWIGSFKIHSNIRTGPKAVCHQNMSLSFSRYLQIERSQDDSMLHSRMKAAGRRGHKDFLKMAILEMIKSCHKTRCKWTWTNPASSQTQNSHTRVTYR